MSESSADDLPIIDCLPAITSTLASQIPVVLKAPPGAGKTTGVPPAVIQSKAGGDGKILLVQPRRLAARAAARRLARLLGSRLGEQVGYHVRFDKRYGRETKLIAMTTGVLVRRMHQDPLLEDVSCVLLDEFHERSLEVDLALGMLHRVRTTLRPELRLVVMSATLDPQPIVGLLGDAVPVISQGRAFAVDIRHTTAVSRAPLERQVAEILPGALDTTRGDVLIFLPGVGEIRRTRRTIESMRFSDDFAIHELYGDLPPEKQDAVLAQSDQRKIVLATNIAETSITIPGVTCVIDTGLARVMRFDSHVGLPKLQLEPISQASAEQRAGRAGRTEPGVCYRLWPAVMHRARCERDAPEIERTDFSGALLTLAAWGEFDVPAFPWLTPPPTGAVEIATKLLRRLDAIDERGRLTTLGQQMLALPLHPRLARFMVEAKKHEIVQDAALAAALLTERDPFGGRPQSNQESPRTITSRTITSRTITSRTITSRTITSRTITSSAITRCGVTQRVDRLKRLLKGDDATSQHASAARHVQRVAAQISRLTDAIKVEPLQREPHDRPIARALLAAYPDRVARRRTADDDRGVMVGGRGVRFDGRSNAGYGEFFLCIDVDSRGAEAAVRIASEIESNWLDQRWIRELDELFFNPTLKSVVARRRRYFDDLLLSEFPIQCRAGAEVAEILARHAKQDLKSAMPTRQGELSGFIERVRFLVANMPELDLPPLNDPAIEEVLQTLCRTRTSIGELQTAPWLDFLRGRYDYEQLRWIDKHAPARLRVPSGNEITIQYRGTGPPVMEVRIQELFGWKETPRIAGGAVAVQLHLLGPNRRPQQITDDLESFWRETYDHVRKEMKRRYPKHHWPESPIDAQATRNGLKPKPERRE